MSKGRVVALLVLVGLAVSAASFIGGSVGAAIVGREPVPLLATGPPHIDLEPGHPFGTSPITNTLLASWVSGAVLIALFWLATRRIQVVPTGLQNAAEYIFEFASDFIEQMVGKEHERRFFPVVMTVFLFIVANAWLGLLPGYESVKVNGVPLLRSANTDINVPLMLAVACVVFIEYMGFRSRGWGYLGSFLDLRYGGLYLFAGILEMSSHVVRVASFSLRLFGNMVAGAVLIGVALFVVPLVLPSFFYGLEALFGLVQGLIFSGLTVVFGYAAVGHGEL